MTAHRSMLGLAGYWAVFRASFTQIGENNLALISAGVAFFSMLSLFPALAALIALLALVADPVVVISQLEDMRGLMPADVYDIINQQVVSLVTASNDTIGRAGLVSLLLALWSARAGVGAMIIGLNAVYGTRNRRTLRHYLRALLLTLALVGVGITALISLVVIPVVLAFFPLGFIGTLLVDALRWIAAVFVLFAGIGLLYRFGPNREVTRFRLLSLGAVIAVVFWVILSVGFSYYVANFGNYNQVYGSIGAVVAKLVWLWISSFLVLYGAAIDGQVEAHRKDLPPAVNVAMETLPDSVAQDPGPSSDRPDDTETLMRG